MHCYYNKLKSKLTCADQKNTYSCSKIPITGHMKYFKLDEPKEREGIYLRYSLKEISKTEPIDFYCEIKKNELQNKIKLLNPGNSCFMDVVLICLFAQPNKYILDKIILNKSFGYEYKKQKIIETDRKNKCDVIHREILNVYKNIQSDDGNICFMKNRKDMKICLAQYISGLPSDLNDIISDGYANVSVFMRVLCQIYELNGLYNYSLITLNKIKQLLIQANKTNINDIPLHGIMFDYPELPLVITSKYYITDEKQNYNNYHVNDEAGLFILDLQRLSVDTSSIQSIITKEFKIQDQITLYKTPFYLSGIVLYENKHYTSIVKYFGKWYLYNDQGINYITNQAELENLNSIVSHNLDKPTSQAYIKAQFEINEWINKMDQDKKIVIVKEFNNFDDVRTYASKICTLLFYFRVV